MIAIDTDILIHAHRSDSEWHERTASCVHELAEARSSWAIPWPCLHEFLTITTHPRIWDPPTPTGAALDQVKAWPELGYRQPADAIAQRSRGEGTTAGVTRCDPRAVRSTAREIAGIPQHRISSRRRRQPPPPTPPTRHQSRQLDGRSVGGIPGSRTTPRACCHRRTRGSW